MFSKASVYFVVCLLDVICPSFDAQMFSGICDRESKWWFGELYMAITLLKKFSGGEHV